MLPPNLLQNLHWVAWSAGCAATLTAFLLAIFMGPPGRIRRALALGFGTLLVVRALPTLVFPLPNDSWIRAIRILLSLASAGAWLLIAWGLVGLLRRSRSVEESA
jgi:hypothetical protein